MKHKPWMILSTVMMMALAVGCAASDDDPEEPEPAATEDASEPEETEDASEPEEGEAAAGEAAEEPAELEGDSLKVGFSGQPDFTQIMNFEWLEVMSEAHGVDAEAVVFEGTSPPFRALVAGEVDMVVGQLTPGVNLVTETGEDLVMIAGDIQASDYMLVSVPDLTSIDDLSGRVIGTAGPGAVSDTLTLAALQEEGIPTDEVEFIQIGGTSARMAALMSGQIDAAPAHFAEGYATVDEGMYDLYPVHEGIGPYLFHGVWTTQSWVDANPNLGQLAIDEFIESVRWAATNEDEYMAASEPIVEGLSESARRRAYAKFLEVEMFAVNGGLDPDLVDATVQLEQEVGGLSDDIPPASQWVFSDWVDSYLERYGEQ